MKCNIHLFIKWLQYTFYFFYLSLHFYFNWMIISSLVYWSVYIYETSETSNMCSLCLKAEFFNNVFLQIDIYYWTFDTLNSK